MARRWAVFRVRLAETLRPMPFAIGALAGLLLAYLAPFGSDNGTVAQRIVYWPGVVLLGTLLGVIASAAVDALADPKGRRPWLCVVLTALTMTAPGAGLVWLVTRAMFGGTTMIGGFFWLLGPVFLLSLAMTAVNHMAALRQAALAVAKAAPEEASAPQPQPVRFRERLPVRLRGAAIEAVTAEDHYLRIYTDRGSDLILLRLADAIAELEGLDGAQTHRSWWVAKAAVRDVRRSDGRATLILASGVEAPVSRSYLAALRDQGWF